MAYETRTDVILAEVQRPLQDTSTLPDIRLSNPAAEFIDNRIDFEDHRAFSRTSLTPRSAALTQRRSISTPPSVSTAAAPADPLALYRESEKEQEIFLAALEKFENDLPEKYKTKFNIKGKHTWSEVIAEAQIAEMKYKRKGSGEGPFSRVRGSFRKLQGSAGALSTWLEIVPQSTYGSVITGSFKVIIRAATKMNEIRDFVFGALASIPEEIEKAQLAMEFNEDMTMSTMLHKRIADLYVSILKVLQHVVKWLESKSGVKHLIALVQQGEYEKSLQSKVETFKLQVGLVKEAANLCTSQRLQQMDRRVNAISDKVDLALAYAEETRSDKAEILEDLRPLRSLYELLISNPHLNPRTGQLLPMDRWPMEPPPVRQRQKKAISREALMDELDYDAELLTDNLAMVLRWGNDLSLREQERAVYITQSPKLRDWLLSPRNAVLLINGNEPEVASARVHATSFISAHLVNSVAATRGTAGMCWFCGLHRDTRRDAKKANVRGVIASLAGQLLAQYAGFDLYFFKRRHLQAVRNGDFESLCNLLDELILQLPPGTITFCVLDWLSCLEFGGAQEVAEVKGLVKRLMQVVESPLPGGNKFKLVFVNAGGPCRAGKLISREETINVPETVDGDGSGFTRMMWKMRVGDQIQDLSKKGARK